MNKTIMLARLTKDVETMISSGEKQTTIARFSLAAPRRFKTTEGKDADFYNAVAFGKTAELIEKYLFKGSQALFEGVIENNNYINKDGNTVYGFVFRVESFDFVGNRNSGTSTENTATEPTVANKSSNDGFMNIPDGAEQEGLPFC